MKIMILPNDALSARLPLITFRGYAQKETISKSTANQITEG